MNPKSVIFIVLFSGSLPAQAQEPTSENNERLRRALERYPQADANKDGILTRAEGRAYRAKLKERQADKEKETAEFKASPGVTTRTEVYKTVGERAIE